MLVPILVTLLPLLAVGGQESNYGKCLSRRPNKGKLEMSDVEKSSTMALKLTLLPEH